MRHRWGQSNETWWTVEVRFLYARSDTRLRSPGAQIDRAGQVEYEHGDGGSVNVTFEVDDVTRPLVAVGELQRPRDKATRQQPRTGALEQCLLNASVKRRRWHEHSGSR